MKRNTLLATLAVAIPAHTSMSCAAPAQTGRPGAPVTWVSSTGDIKWQVMPNLTLGAAAATPPEVRITPRRAYQTIKGFGGCFNEMGWVALGKATEADRQQTLNSLFSDNGAAFHLARLPIGASDFALDGYSLDDTPGDYALKDFSIERDRKNLLPFVKAAMRVRPDLQCWGSPWSPPAWMKTNGKYNGGSIKSDPATLTTYANYFVRWLEAYRADGVKVYALSPQNEPNILSPYPSCLWTGAQLHEFIGKYLGPTLKAKKANVELWVGFNGDPINGGENPNDRLTTVLEDARANSFLTGIAFQYDSRNQIALANEMYPDKKLMQSETMCFDGANSWGQAQELFALMKRYFDGGAEAYFAWNMVLDETGLSNWNWRQNSLVSVDRATGKVTYNGEFYVMRHFSQYIKSGARRVQTSGVWGDRIAFANPDGSLVLVMGNSLDKPIDVSIAVAARPQADTIKAQLPARSINTFVVPAPAR